MFDEYDSNRLAMVLNVYHKMKAIFCLLCCMIILMPQGWCCWLVPLQCCSNDAVPSCCHTVSQATESCCDACAESQNAQDGEDHSGSIPETCSKCLHDTVRPVFENSTDWFVVPVAILPVELSTGLPCSLLFVSHDVHTVSPPLHVHLCVWRC